MRFNPGIHHRHSIRLKGYDYSKDGTYFITICTQDRENIFGKIDNGAMILNGNGIIVENTWFDLPNHNSNVIHDAFIIMPNHIHAIITVVGVGSGIVVGVGSVVGAGSEPAPTEHLLPEIIRQFKTFSSKKINIRRNTMGIPVWQRNYYEHIVRSEDELDRIREYIKNNPVNWYMDDDFWG